MNTEIPYVSLQVIYQNQSKENKKLELTDEFIEFDKRENSNIKIQLHDKKHTKKRYVISYIIASSLLSSFGPEIFDMLTTYILTIDESVDDLTIHYLGQGKFQFNKNVKYSVTKKHKKIDGFLLLLFPILIFLLLGMIVYSILIDNFNTINLLLSITLIGINIFLLRFIIKTINRIDFKNEIKSM